MIFTTPKQLTDHIIADPALYALTVAEVAKLEAVRSVEGILSEADIDAIIALPTPVSLFIANTFSGTRQVRSDWRHSDKLRKLISQSDIPSEYNYTGYGTTFKDIFNSIPTDQLKPLMLSTTYKRECERRNTQKFDADKKQIQPNLFSYEIFRKYLLTLKTGLTGKDAVKYVNDIAPTYHKKDQPELRMKFIKLIWDNARHTISLTKAIQFDHLQVGVNHLPFVNFASPYMGSIPTHKCEHVAFSPYIFQQIASRHNIPVSQNLMDATDSSAYTYNTSTKKPTPISQAEALLIKDYLYILNIVIPKTTNEIELHYFTIMQAHLLNELATNSTPSVVQAILGVAAQQLDPIQQLNQQLKDTYELINKNNTED